VPATLCVTSSQPAQQQQQQPQPPRTPAAVLLVLPLLPPTASWPWSSSCWRRCCCGPLTPTGPVPGWQGCCCSWGVMTRQW